MKKFLIRNTKCIFLTMFFAFAISSCNKFIDIDPPITGISADNVYTTNATAAAVITGIYTNMSNESISGTFSIIPSLLADELNLYDLNNMEYVPCFTNSLTPTLAATDFWSKLYKIVFAVNDAIEGLQKSTQLSTTVKLHLLGEAKFLRAYMYFYLVNYYGDVPLAVSTDYKLNNSLRRTSKITVYELIIQDLKEAIELLSEKYIGSDAISSTSSTERVRPNKWAAKALLSRTYLYYGDYVKAESEANDVINNIALFELPPLNDVFLKNNKEVIWQLQTVGVNYLANTQEGRLFVLPVEGPSGDYPVVLSTALVKSFDNRDERRKNWVDSVVVDHTVFYYANKYKVGAGVNSSQEYPMMLRLGEQYLIRAEARIQQGKIVEGIGDLNVIRMRATDLTLPVTAQLPQLPTTFTKEEALTVVENERKFELFTEWGHRWLDIKRTNRADAVLKSIKGANWQTTDQLLPIPQDDMKRNPSLAGQQNPGYN